jgi:peptidoglycan/LPS O-acetylase OafA/YrhL
LNGLRGYGALSVFIYHVCQYNVRHQYELRRDPKDAGDSRYVNGETTFDEAKFILEGGEPPRWFWDIEENRYFHFLFDGPFWVSVFFILSGFVLTISFFKRK